jgi:streptomycin 6-kinase
VDLSSAVLDATRGRLLARFGARVEPWWERLPAALAELAERWELVVGEAVGRGNTSLVVRCRRVDGGPAMLKLTPDAALGGAEALALRSWESSGRVPLVWGYDAAMGALLLEAIPSETPLSELQTDVGQRDIANLIGALHHSGSPGQADGVASLADRVEFIFEHWVERHGRRSDAVTRAVPVVRLQLGYELARELAADASAPVLCLGTYIQATCSTEGPLAAWSPSTLARA